MLNTLPLQLLLLITLISSTTSLSLPPPKIPLPPTHQQHQQQALLPDSSKITKNLTTHFRPALESDLSAITTIIVEAFSPSATWNYVMPDHDDHKQDIWTCLHGQIVHEWQHLDRNKTFLNVITVPLDEDDDSHNDKGEEVAVAFAVWNMRSREDASSSHSSSTSTTSFPPFPSIFNLPSLLQTCTPIPGTNHTRAADFERQMQPVMRRYFSTDYPAQLYLNLLATHPDWDGNGFAARHVRWGMEVSRGGGLEVDVGAEEGRGAGEQARKAIPVTLLATPAGWPVYEGLGFEGVENATVGMLDGLGELWFEVCKWDG